MLRGLRSAFRPFTDDRGRRCALVNARQVSTVDTPPKHWEHLAEMRQDLGLLYAAVIHGPSAAVAFSLGLSTWLTWVVIGFMEIPVIAVLAPLVHRPLFYPLAHIYRHQVVAAGSCASCGYALTGLPISPDGHLDCPECRAGWRADRLTCPEPVEGEERRRKLRSKLDTALSFRGVRDSRDHRGNATSLTVFRPRKGWVGHYGDACHAAAVSIHQPGDSKSMVVMFACFLGAAAVFLMAWLVTTGYGYLPWWGGVFILLLAALVVVGFAAGVSDLSVNPEQIERATLSRGLCPSCWELIQGLPAAEDGCSMCPECGSAWRLPTDQPDPADGS